ncbi:MAG: hypothetical protein PHY93_05240 [Bacteriovorax sp.]|nr:hypothetical protein [Bacteriovorax sp.]
MHNLKLSRPQILGDKHNGGKSVNLNIDGRIEKPRPCLAECFFLSEKSPLRVYFKENSIFNYFPNLEFYNENLSEVGVVNFLNLNTSSFSNGDAVKMSEAVGNLLAISQWFGLSDLHHENIKYGHNEKGKFIFAPIDIECFFQNIKLPFQTGLISKDHTDIKFGIKNIMDSNVLLPIHVVEAYLSTMKVLFLNRNQIFKIINDVFSPKDLARVLLKNTSVYGRWCNGAVEIDHLILEEVDQLKAGDIPYFFRYLNSKTINYWNNGEVAVVKDATDTSFILTQLLLSEMNIYWEELEKFAKYGALQIADRLTVEINLYHEQISGLELKKNDNTLEIITKEWRSKCVL